ncbi:hypothetical protein [Candidatus Solincola sp.]|nr:hypothetical protein [Actinomycetota bacterium]MDI7252899.1 hypothetical protein [Actinomycetota bacterium]
MKTCPWCGRNNLDSDEYCFNCERDLNAVPEPDEELELERELRRIRVRRPPSLVRLIVSSLVRKVVLGILALGAFFIFALLAIWISYDNSTVALAALAFLCLALLAAVYYPDARLSRKVGTRGVLVSLLSNAILLAAVLPPGLWFLERRGYISGMKDFMLRTWWFPVAFLLLGCLVAWLSGRRASAETASP